MSVGFENSGQRPGQPSSTQRTGTEEPLEAIKEDVTQIADTAMEQGRQLFSSAKDQAASFVDERKDMAAESVANLARSLRDATKQFEDRPNIRAFADSAAESLEQFAENIRGRSFNELFEDVERVVRRRPGAIAATTMATGFLLARFIKSSAEGIREKEFQRRNAGYPSRSGSQQGQRTQGQRARAQSSPGSAYGGGQV